MQVYAQFIKMQLELNLKMTSLIKTNEGQKMSFHARKKMKKIYKYDCTITGESFKTTEEAPRPDELMTVQAFYQMHPEKDDRPAEIKLKIKNLEEEIKL